MLTYDSENLAKHNVTTPEIDEHYLKEFNNAQ